MRASLARSAPDAARRLLGAILVHDDGRGVRRAGRIVEVEAYGGPEDAASHARFGRTRRNGAMFTGPGTAYVYLVYGMHDCLNVVTGPEGAPSAVLVRAVEPLEGLDEMRAALAARAVARGRLHDAATRAASATARLARVADARLASGPALVTAAFGIDRSHDGLHLLDPASAIRLEPGSTHPWDRIVAGPRIGVDYAAEPWRTIAWRFAIAGHPSVSRPLA